jgi:hypothetical protein
MGVHVGPAHVSRWIWSDPVVEEGYFYFKINNYGSNVEPVCYYCATTVACNATFIVPDHLLVAI